MLQTDRCEDCGIAGNGLDCASAPTGGIDEYFSEPTRLEESKASRVGMAGMHEVQQFMRPSLRKPSSFLCRSQSHSSLPIRIAKVPV